MMKQSYLITQSVRVIEMLIISMHSVYLERKTDSSGQQVIRVYTELIAMYTNAKG
jgi:hypothetical protein